MPLEDTDHDRLRRYWYIACPSLRLRRKPLAVRLFDLDLALFRDSSGAPRALLDRCCHRGVQLSLGSVAAGELVCRYHGWHYDGSGRCVAIPSLLEGQKFPAGVQVQSFPCLEQDGHVWVWPDTSVPPAGTPEAIPEFAGRRWRQGTMPVAAAAPRVLENNLDWCHPAYTHPWTHGQFFVHRFRGAHDQAYEIRLSESGLTVFAPPTETAAAPVPEQPIVRVTFTLPDRVRVEFWRPFHMLIYLHAVPTGPHGCRLEWMTPRFLPVGPKLRLSRGTPTVLAQDRLVLESAELAHRKGGAAFEHSVPADASTLLLRLVLRHAARGSWATTWARLSHRRVIRLRA
ncbi:MAG: aromatic ring-hydroxylating dioxygenase subunit alpha [Alphaproteobacteria bacterium]|nr:aromatic ring-hydroxylating dioxygenase subunit alpha [Alphaproteobacteria bacterium]